MGWKKRGESSAAVVSEKMVFKIFFVVSKTKNLWRLKNEEKRLFGVFDGYFERLEEVLGYNF